MMRSKDKIMIHLRQTPYALSPVLALALVLAHQACGNAPDGPNGAVCEEGTECSEDRDDAGSPAEAAAGNGGSGTNAESGQDAGGTSSSGNAPPLTPGAHFPGSGTGYRPLTPGCGPETAAQCTGSCEQGTGSVPTDLLRPPATLCFSGDGDPTPDDPAVVIEQLVERSGSQEYVHVRVTFDPRFTDNTYGDGSCCGWPEQRGHTFGDLSRSDHTELLLTNSGGETAMHFKIDLISPSSAASCGHGTLGVSGGDGSVLSGDAEHVLAVATSADRNLNGCGYCENVACAPSGDCTEDSPPTDESFSGSPETPNWDYRQVYEVWVDTAAFGDGGFGQAYITYTHSSPAKAAGETVTVEPTPCPPTWDTPYCPPNVILEGGNCFGTPPDGGGDPGCPPNEQVYIISEGASLCTPIPYANNPGMDPCPAGYSLDLASEGRFCLPNE
jgi:hypothetical protein